MGRDLATPRVDTQDNNSEAHVSKLRTECGRPGVHFQGPVVWCQECYDRLRLGEIPRVCEPWDSDTTPLEQRYQVLFHAAKVVWRCGIMDENEIIPTFAFATRSFELENLDALRERIASTVVGNAEWTDLQDTFRRAFVTFELARVVDGVPIIYSRPFKIMAHTYPATGVVEKKGVLQPVLAIEAVRGVERNIMVAKTSNEGDDLEPKVRNSLPPIHRSAWNRLS